ncbi:MAG TPA: SDR family NAD(P)-dependent oxidoreductase, partial [Sorangium sp.]|nr:SDR family NAD(P)-dependent oxidoreductase [Sorangium sp.]
MVRALVAKRAELELNAVGDDDRMLKDLHLNSIMVAEIVTEAARALGVAPPAAPTEFANATLHEMAQAVAAGDALQEAAEGQLVAGVEDWVRVFAMVDEPLAAAAEASFDAAASGSEWRTVGAGLDGLAAALRRTPLAGWLIRTDDAKVVLRAAKAALERRQPARFVLIHCGAGATGMARSLHLEAPWLKVTVIALADMTQVPCERLVAEVCNTHDFRELVYTDGEAARPTLVPLHAEVGGEWALGADDVVVVTGGGKGITAECALALAKATGAALGIVGRADPASDEELAHNLVRLGKVTRVSYARADVTDAAQVQAAVDKVAAELGTITGVIHGASVNVPALLGDLSEAAVDLTLAVKVGGLARILAALATDELKLLISFGSIIGRSGMRGEGHYA